MILTRRLETERATVISGAESCSGAVDHNHRRKTRCKEMATAEDTVQREDTFDMLQINCDLLSTIRLQRPSGKQEQARARPIKQAPTMRRQVPINNRSKQRAKKQVFLALQVTAMMLLLLLLSSSTQMIDTIEAQEVVVVDVDNSNNYVNGTAATALRPTGSIVSYKPAQLTASFSTPNHLINITHVAYEPVQDILYVGATNALYQLAGNDLVLMHEQSTGPVFDHPLCGITECRGYEELMRPIANVNKVLLVDYKHRKLLACGSTKQGACRRYKLGDISQKEELTAIAVAANDDNSSTYAFIGPARYSETDTGGSSVTSSSIPVANQQQQQQQQQQVLYVGSTYTKAGQSRDLLVPAIGTRILDDGPNLLKLYENSFLDSARIDINSHLRDYFLVNYVFGFTTSNYVYFATVQKKATSRDYEELGYHTRLARVCLTDSSYNSYVEVDLKCVRSGPAGNDSSTSPAPREYPLLQDAVLVDAGSQLMNSMRLTGSSSSALAATLLHHSHGHSTAPAADPMDSKVLIGVFASSRDHTHHAGEHSAVCAFSLAQIEDRFNDNIHACYTGKMQSRNMEYIAGNVQECPRGGQGGNVVNFCHETLKINGTLPIQSEPSISYANSTLTAITATSQLYHQSSASSTVVAATSTAQRQHTVVFAGTSSGHIKKILLNNVTNAHEFEDVLLDPEQNPILSDLHLHRDANQLIAATPYKVLKTPVYDCGQYANCRECSQARNPYCGWCSLKKSCTTKSECVGSAATANNPGTLVSNAAFESKQQPAQQQQQLKWISAAESLGAGKCIELRAIVPEKVPMTSMGKVDLYIDRLPRLPKEHSYRCVFDRREQTSATQTAFGLSCPLPKVMHRPKIQPGRDHSLVDLAVRSSETNTDFLDTKLTFFECQLHTTCKDCLTTSWGCNWCLNENICLFNTSKCERTGAPSGDQVQPNAISSKSPLVQVTGGSSSRASFTLSTLASNYGAPVASLASQSAPTTTSARNTNTIAQVNQCPTFDVGQQKDIVVADGSERELSIRVKNMPSFKGSIQCIVEIENDRKVLRARFDDDRVVCENSTYTYAADVGMIAGQLVAIYSENNILIDKTNFTLYKCHLLGSYLNRPDCSLCQRIDTNFQCNWCGPSTQVGQCRHRSQCMALQEPLLQTCPPPRIDFVHPLAGPLMGGTRVSIEGSNLGQSFEEISANKVFIGNVPCKPVEEEYRPSNRIVCVTSPLIQAPLSSYASNSRRDSSIEGINSISTVVAADVVVRNRAGNTTAPQKFLYKPIQLRDHQPRYGPQSGGTRLVLTGTNLNIGSNLQVMLDEIPCQIETASLSSEQVVCRTSASRQPNRTIRQLRLLIDNVQILRQSLVDPMQQSASTGLLVDSTVTSRADPLDFGAIGAAGNVIGNTAATANNNNNNLAASFGGVYYYSPDPVVTRISPLSAYLSGGRPINVYGSSLSSVQQPRMAVVDPATGKRVNETNCIVQDDQRMQCPAPAVSLFATPVETEQSDTSEQTTVASTATGNQQERDQFRFRISFLMDNVWRLRDLQINQPHLASELVYLSDPKLYPFNSAQYRQALEAYDLEAAAAMIATNQATLPYGATASTTANHRHNYQIESDTYLLQPVEPTLVLFGENLRAAVSEYEITVTVGQDMCNLTQLSSNRIVCSMPMDHMATPTNEDGLPSPRSLPVVVIRIGFNLRQELGYVQYHPQLVEEIVAQQQQVQLQQQQQQQQQLQQQSLEQSYTHMRSMNPADYANYVPKIENDSGSSVLGRISTYISNLLFLFTYLTLAFLLLALVYSSVSSVRRKCCSALHVVARFKQKSQYAKQAARSRLATTTTSANCTTLATVSSLASRLDYKRLRAKLDLLERQLKNECHVGALALQGDLNELVRHVELTGIPLMGFKHFVMRVFFPGIDDHPLISTPQQQNQYQHQQLPPNLFATNVRQQVSMGRPLPMRPAQHPQQQQVLDFQPIERPLRMAAAASTNQDCIGAPMQQFEQLIMSKPFLIAFINTLERQATFSIRDKVNVASLVMIALIERLDYATDVMRTLLFQLVERTVASSSSRSAHLFESSHSNFSGSSSISSSIEYDNQASSNGMYRIGRRLTRRASNLLNGLPTISSGNNDNHHHLGKTVGGSASSLMASTGQVVAQMLLSRVGGTGVGCNGKTAPFESSFAYQSTDIASSDNNFTSTTAFDQKGVTSTCMQQQEDFKGYCDDSIDQKQRTQRRVTATSRQQQEKQNMKLMLRRTDSVVEKMLTNWLALTMYDQFESGEAGRCLYLLFEAIKCQLERGPIDAVSGDAYYSLNESKLLREPMLQFEVVSLYVIVDAAILKMRSSSKAASPEKDQSAAMNLLLDQHSGHVVRANQNNAIYEDSENIRQVYLSSDSANTATTTNTLTLALRVLDCDTVDQVKSKILGALYRNSPYSQRVSVDEVELVLRQPQPRQVTTLRQQQPYSEIVLHNEDSIVNPQQPRRLNTLKHYGVTDQAIMTLNRCADRNGAATIGAQHCRFTVGDVLDEHYSNHNSNANDNPYADIQYGPFGDNNRLASICHLTNGLQVAASRQVVLNTSLNPGAPSSSSSPPSSHSPSMALLASSDRHNNNSNINKPQQQQQQYQGSSSMSSSSTTGNVMDTNSTSITNSSSMIKVANLLGRSSQCISNPNAPQPIYCQIGSTQSQQDSYYCQIGNNNGNGSDYRSMQTNMYNVAGNANDAVIIGRGASEVRAMKEHEHGILLSRMLTSKGTLQNHLDNFFKTILSVRAPMSAYANGGDWNGRAAGTLHKPQVYDTDPNHHLMGAGGICDQSRTLQHHRSQSSGGNSCPPAVKWLFDLLDEAAMKYNVTDKDVVHSWKSNAFLLRFWVNFIKNPNYVLDVEKSTTIDASLSVVAHTLMESCGPHKISGGSSTTNKISKELPSGNPIFTKDVPKYQNLINRFYQDIASMQPVSDHEIAKRLGSLSMMNSGKFDTNLALKELCVYAINYGGELMNSLNNDGTCQQLDLPNQLEQCFRSFTIFEAYR